MNRVCLCLSLSLALPCALACAPRVTPHSTATPTPADVLVVTQTRPVMGTAVEIAIVDDGRDHDADFNAAFAELVRIDTLCSAWKPDSELSRVNAAAGGEPVEVSEELYQLVQRSLEFAERTDGAFDPTFAALWGLWTFGNDGVTTPPDPEVVAARLKLIDWRLVQMDDEAHTIFLPREGMKLSLGGIAKGYATDRVVEILRARDVHDFVIKAGGELYASGRRGDRSWRVGIQDPRGDDPFAAIDLQDAAFDTSGDYERYFESNGVRYHHIIDPATGYPATRSRSVTVRAAHAIDADALSTALFVMGPDKGLDLVESWDGVEAVWVDAAGEVHATSGLHLWMFHPPTP